MVNNLKKIYLSYFAQVVQLEMQIDEMKSQMSGMENLMSLGEKNLKKKVNSLESNLEQLTVMYHQLLSQRSSLKVDNQVISLLIICLNLYN